jgi:hypothetical protein
MAALTLLILAWLTAGGCSSAEQRQSTQITVRVEADPAVARQLGELRVAVYDADSRRDAPARDGSTFALSQGVPDGDEVRLPFSFGVQGDGKRVLLVIEGYAQRGELGDPLIERQVYARFVAGETLLLPVYLSSGCLQLAAVCLEQDQTCSAEALAAPGSGRGAAPEAPELHAYRPGSELPVVFVPPGDAQDDAARASSPSTDSATLDADQDASSSEAGEDGADAVDGGSTRTPDASGELLACARQHECFDDVYPCVGAPDDAYTCSGQFAEWPVHGDVLGSADTARFDVQDPEVALDQVTGLAWQRVVPEVYPGCTGNFAVAGDLCSFDEALAYCAGLKLAGRRARLPSLIELQSLLDLTQPSDKYALDPDAFGTGPVANLFWSRTIVAVEDVDPTAVLVNFEQRSVVPVAVSRFLAVRCVADGRVPAGTPRDRYRVDAKTATVTDTRTGLTWKRDALRVTSDWQSARSACDATAGFRQASYFELLTLMDPTAQGVLLASELRGSALGNITWASTLSGSGTAYFVSFTLPLAGDAVQHEQMRMSVSNPDQAYNYEVRCVRADPR